MADTPTTPMDEVTADPTTPVAEGVTDQTTPAQEVTTEPTPVVEEMITDPIKPPEEVITTDPIKPYTNDVYAATPSSGSGGGDEGDEEDEPVHRRVEPVKASIPEFLQAASADTSEKAVNEWVNQATTFNTENPSTGKGEESFDTTLQSEGRMDETVSGDPSASNQDQELLEEDLPTTFKIFVSNLPQGLFNSELMELFDQYGEVVECEIFAKNYAFVHMTSEESGVTALEALNGFELRGCRINVKRSVNTTGTPGKPGNEGGKPSRKEETEPLEPGVEIGTFKLYIGNLNDEVTKESVEKLLEPFGRTVEIEIFRSTSAFVHMETEEGAKKAMEELNGTTLPDCEKPLVVSESKNPEGPTLPTIKLMVRNLAAAVTAQEVRDLFTPHGLVLKVILSPKPSSSTHRTATVHLEQFGNIRSAIKDLTGQEVGGSEIKVEATFDKPAPVKSKPKPSNSVKSSSSRSSSQDPYGSWQPVNSNSNSFKPSSYPQPSEWASPNKMRLIPMPSKADFQKFPRTGGRGGRRLLNPQVCPPPLMAEPLPYRSTWGRNDGYNNDYDYSYNQALHDGFGGGYSNYEEETEEDNEYEVYDWSQHSGGNEYPPPPTKIPRNNPWIDHSQNFAGRPGKQNGKKSWEKHMNTNNYSNNQKKKNPFPQLPTADRFPKARPPQSNPPPSLLSFQAPKPENNDWSADIPLSNLSSSDFYNQDFSADEPVSHSTNAVPFDYSTMKRKNNSAQNRQWNPNPSPNPFGNAKGHGQGNPGKTGKGRKGKARHPGLGTTQQQKKVAQQTGNDEAFYNNFSTNTNPSEWQQIGSSSASTSESSSSNNAPRYFQQNWSFTKGNQKKQGNKRPTPQQMKEAEEEQKRQYAEYLKQKPWLYQAIPGTVKKVQQ